MELEEIKALAFKMVASGDDLNKLTGHFLEIDEAICWVAFDQFPFPAIGPKAAHEFLLHVDFSAWLDEEAERHEHVFRIAREQVFNAIENGHILLVGKESERHADEESGSTGEPFFTFVTPQMLAEGGWNELGRSYEIGELQFDGLFVRLSDLERIFGPLKKSALQVGSLVKEPNSTIDAQSGERDQIRPRGRRPKYDWEAILTHVSHSVGRSRGYPENQAALERMIAQHCMEAFGDEPAASLIRQKASGLFDMLRRNSQ